MGTRINATHEVDMRLYESGGMSGDGWVPAHLVNAHDVDITSGKWKSAGIGSPYVEVRQQHEAGHAIYSSGPGHSGVPPQECDYVMELKIPRFVVEQVYPNLAFNSSAISTAMKIGDSTVRYDVAKEAFLIRGESLDSLSLSKLVIANEMSAHGFHLEIEGEAPTKAPPFVSSPERQAPPAHPPQRQASYVRTDPAAAASRASGVPAPTKLAATTSSMDSPATSALPTPIRTRVQDVGSSPAGGHMPSHHRTSAEATRAQGGDEAVGRDKFIWVEQNGKLVMMKVEDETSSEDELIEEEMQRLEQVKDCQNYASHASAGGAQALGGRAGEAASEAEMIIRDQAAEIDRLNQRVERQAMLLEDRLEVEAELRKKEKAQYEEVAQLKASVAALQNDKKQLAQNISHVAKERDQARAEKAAAVSDANCMHAMLQDAGTYIEHMRNDIAVLQMNLQHARAETMSFAQAAAHAHAAAEDIKVAAAAEKQKTNSGGFAMDHITKSIETAVEEIKEMPEDDRRKQVKALRLRWHPDKNPILKEFATEVSKVLNAAVAAMEASLQERAAAAGSAAAPSAQPAASSDAS